MPTVKKYVKDPKHYNTRKLAELLDVPTDGTVLRCHRCGCEIFASSACWIVNIESACVSGPICEYCTRVLDRSKNAF